MIKRIALLVATLMLTLPASVLAAEASQGIIEGQLVNGTDGGGSVADVDVTLMTYLNGSEVGSANTKTDAEGRFVFDSLSTEPDYSYQVTTTFQEAEYSSDRLNFGDGETSKFVEVAVYDAITSDEAIKVATSHTVIYVGADGLQVEEYHLMVNDADRTYIGSKEVTTDGKKETLRFPLPKGAFDPQYLLGLMVCCIVAGQDGFVDTMPVLPGTKEIAYSYKVSRNSGKYTFSRNIAYPTFRYELLVQGDGIEVNSDQLAARGPVEIRGSRFQHYSGGEFAAGDTIMARLSGLPESSNQRAFIWAAVVLTVLVTGFGLSYSLRKRRLQPVSPEGSLTRRSHKLFVELAQLDDDFESGRVPEETYRRLRTVKKAKLVALMQKSKEEGDNS